jgi:hypothetical protein
LGRAKKVGNDICPICENLGRFTIFSSRNGEVKDARKRNYLRFRHNDKTIKDCYGIEQAIKENKLEQIRNGDRPELRLAIYQLSESIQSLGNSLKIIGECMKEHKITPEDDKMLTSMMIEGGKKHLENNIAMWKYIQLLLKNQKTPEERNMIKNYHETMENAKKQWWNDNSEEFKKNPEKFVLQQTQNMIKNDKMLYAINYWMEKYELPKRKMKGKKLSAKLSESAFGSSKYNADYIIRRSE